MQIDDTVSIDPTFYVLVLSSLLPSVPVDISLNVLETHLNGLEIEDEKRKVYIGSARLCMRHNYFQFREKICMVEFGTNMGNPLSPIIADLFMSALEVNLKKQNLLPQVWLRYVDDVTHTKRIIYRATQTH